jgi:putative oxidoreductase
MPNLDAWSPRLLSVLRLMAGLLFLEHGLMKLAHFPAAIPGSHGGLAPMVLAAGIIETVGGALIAAGLFTRLAAFICSGEMAVAYFTVHMKGGIWPALNGGDAAILFCFVFLYLVFAGGGAWSLDAAIRGRRGAAAG